MLKSVQLRLRATVRHVVNFILAVALASAFLGISPSAQAAGKLNIYNWGDYINPDVLTRFTEDTGIEVTLDTYGSNEEMLAKIQAGATGYDIVFPSVHVRDIMQKLGLLYDAKVNTLKGFENIDPANMRSRYSRYGASFHISSIEDS